MRHQLTKTSSHSCTQHDVDAYSAIAFHKEKIATALCAREDAEKAAEEFRAVEELSDNAAREALAASVLVKHAAALQKQAHAAAILEQYTRD